MNEGAEKPFPAVPKVLLEALEEMYPDRMPDTNSTNEYFRLRGEVDVVRLLRARYEEQNKLSQILHPK